MNEKKSNYNTEEGYFPFIRLGIVAISILYLFSSSAVFLFNDWSRDEFSHGFLLPFLALLMIWHLIAGWDKQACPHWLGIIVIGISLGLLFIGEISTFRQLTYFSMVLVILGLSLTYLGKTITKRLTPAFVLLLFAVPIPFIIYNPISLSLKLLSTSMGVFLIDFFGYSVYQDGNIIDLGTFKLQVVDACNGLRYLFPIGSFGFLIAYLTKDALWKKIVIFVSVAPITIIMNAFRIAIIGVTVNTWGIEAAEGFLHLFEGFFVFMVCIALLILETMLLLRIGTRGTFDWSFFSIPHQKVFIRPKLNSKISYWLPAMCCVLTTLNIAYGLASNNHQPRTHVKTSLDIPTIVQKWQGKPNNLSSYILDELKLTDYVLADYKNINDPLEPHVNLYIAYYEQQQVGSTIHSPATCLPGGGWQREQSRVISLSLTNQKLTLPITRMVVGKGDKKLIIYYWYHERGRNLTNQISAKWYLLVDSLLKGRNDGSLIRLTTSTTNNGEDNSADERLKAFLDDFYPVIIHNLTNQE